MTFNKFINQLGPYFFPDPVVGSGGTPESKSLSKDDIIDFLGDDEDKEPEVIDLEGKDKKEKDKKEEDEDKDKDKDKEDEEDEEEDSDEEDDDEDDELKELEDELDDLEDPDDEKLELASPVSRREILKKYPKLFKDFPYLENAYYREQQFTKFFPNPADAEAAVQSAETLSKLEVDLGNGDISKVLQSIEKGSPKAFAKLVNNYLPALAKINKEAYQHIFGNISKHIIYSMVEKGRKSKDEELTIAAEVLNKFIFNSDEFEPPKDYGDPEAKGDDKPEDDNKKKELERLEGRFNTSVEDVSNRVKTIFKATIKGNIDKKEQMTEFVRDAATDKALDKLENLINRDTRFKMLVDRLWEQAVKDDFSKDSLDKIKKAFVSKAKSLLPPVLKEARQTALKGMGNKSKKAKDEDDNDSNDRNDEQDRRPNKEKSNSQSKSTKKGQIPAGMTSLEYLMSDD